MMEETLPERWALVKIEDIADVVEPGFPYGKYNIEGIGIPHLRPMNINGQGNLSFDEIKYVNVDNPPLLHKGDILFNNTNSPVWVGKTTIVTQGEEYTFSNHMTRLTLNSFAGEPQFFALQLQYMQRLGYFLERCIHHVNQASISSSFLAKNVDILVAPTNEQHRIVAAIEQQFTRLDNAVASLRSAQAKAKQYRASLLKAAVEGELTKAWRAEHPAEETGAQLLQRILAERHARWEKAELAKMRERGITPRDNKWKERYEEPQGPDVERLPELPEGWCWATVEQIAQIQGGIQKQPSRIPRQNAYPYLRVANVLRGRLDLTAVEKMELFGNELETLRLKIGDLLIVEGNGSKTEIGRSALWNGEIEDCVHQNHIIRVRLNHVLSRYVDFYWNSPDGNRRVMDVAASTTGLYTLSVNKISHLPIPLPPLTEQDQIVAEVEAELSNIAKLEEVTENSLKKAEHDRQSILQEAFAGRLVPQDPDDEPASVLLERIREERKRREEQERVVRVDRKGGQMVERKRRRSRKTEGDQQGGRLYETLVEAGQPLSPDELFRRVGLQVDEQPGEVKVFYGELQPDVQNNLIRETRPAYNSVLLEALEPSEEMPDDGDEEEIEDEAVAEAAEGMKQGEQKPVVDRPTLWDVE